MAAGQHGAGVGNGGFHLACARPRTGGPRPFDRRRLAHRLASRLPVHDAPGGHHPQADGSRAPRPREGRTTRDRSAASQRSAMEGGIRAQPGDVFHGRRGRHRAVRQHIRRCTTRLRRQRIARAIRAESLSCRRATCGPEQRCHMPGKYRPTHSWEICKVRKDGSSLWVRENAKAVRRVDNQLIVLIACEDVTERKQAENALRQSEMYQAEAQRLSHTGSFGWRVASGEIIWSEETFRMFGYDKAPSIKHATVFQRVHPEDRARVEQTIDRASRDGKDFEHGYRLLMPDGAVKHVHATAHAVTDASGGVEFVGAVTDVTAHKQAEVELHEAQTNLAHVTRVTALGEMAASIAHEVNQPLAAVVTNAAACLRWLDREPANLKEARGTLQSIVKDGNRAGEVIQRVRALANKTADQKAPL